VDPCVVVTCGDNNSRLACNSICYQRDCWLVF